MRTFVAADDITGANDIGVMYAKSGLKTVTYTCGSTGLFREGESVCILDTDSRFLEPAEAYDRVYRAVKAQPDCDRYFDKQCSVFRGNIGAEFDAMLDALGEDFAAVVLGYPANGRTTLHAVHYVHGVKLEDSQFRRDPVHPMTCSNLVEILSAQTKRKVGSITLEDLDRGEEYLHSLLERMREAYSYVIFDVRHEEDLALIARVIRDVKVVCGSAQIAYFLGLEQCRSKREPVLALAGSLTPQTKAQVAYMKQKGYPTLELDTLAIARGEDPVPELVSRGEALLAQGGLALIHTMEEPEQIARTKAVAARRGMTNVAISSAISDALSRAAQELNRRRAIRKWIILGGDTSAAFCRGMGISGMEIGQEIEPGIPLLKMTGADLHFVLKSGSFGSDAFIENAYFKLLPK